MDRTKAKKLHCNKKMIGLTVALTLLSGFCACMGKKVEPLKYISHEELMSYQKEVELTNENWEEYFTVEEDGEWKIESEISKRKMSYINLKRGTFVLPENVIDLIFIVESQMERVVKFEKTGETIEKSENVSEGLQVIIGPERPKVDFYELGYQCDSFVVDENGEPALEIDWSNPLSIITASIDRRKSPKNITLNTKDIMIMKYEIPEEKWNLEEEDVRYLCVGDENSYFRIYELGFCDDIKRYLEKHAEE